jgi:hypothetical protein
MGAVATARGSESAGTRAGRVRADQGTSSAGRSGALLATWQTLTGLIWVVGQILLVFGRYYARAARSRLAASGVGRLMEVARGARISP